MYGDNVTEGNCLFRATYLLKVLDLFAKELVGIAAELPQRWRSRVLNPILQRQLAGVLDNVPNMVELQVGRSVEEAAQFYLTVDPLNPDNTQIGRASCRERVCLAV